jgi:hypothetical protein
VRGIQRASKQQGGRTAGGAREQVPRADLGQELGVEAPRLNRQVVQLFITGESNVKYQNLVFRVSGHNPTGLVVALLSTTSTGSTQEQGKG